MLLSACGQQSDISKEILGEQLFNDVALSRDGRQSCASCHSPQHAFIDPRINITSADADTPGAVSLGQDGVSLGDINVPSAAYTAFVPEFYFDKKDKVYKGGLFLNGREANLVAQAKQPLLNPVEMQNTKQGVVAAVKANYAAKMKLLYGDKVFENTDHAYNAIADAIATFERTNKLSPFDSKFDKYLRGKAVLTPAEQRGLDLFVAEEKGNCAACHIVPKANSSKMESVFTDFSYDNLGAPKNSLVRSKNGKGATFVDNGLFDNPKVDDPQFKGAFRVPSLRNVAVTAPYMHNGVFKDLKTAVQFYNTRDVAGAKNPETGRAWRQAEVAETKNTEEMGDLGLSDAEVDDIVSFLKTLTDARYEHLIK